MIYWKLNRVMADKRITGKELAQMLEVHPNTVSKLRRTDEMPSINGRMLAKLCQMLQCQFTDLLEQN